MIKNFTKKILNKFGFDIINIKSKFYNISFDNLLKNKIKKKNPLIIDVGGNIGQSIEKNLKLFDTPIIHSFEPLKKEFSIMQEKFKSNKNIFLNNYALGSKNEKKYFYIAARSSVSSINKFNLKTDWVKNKSSEYHVKINNFVKKKEKIECKKLYDYIKNNNIDTIDFMKIDTQGTEDDILAGTKNKIKKIKFIQVEIIFDNTYNKYLSFYDIEKYLLPNNFRLVGLDLFGNNLFTNLVFSADAYYLNKSYYNI